MACNKLRPIVGSLGGSSLKSVGQEILEEALRTEGMIHGETLDRRLRRRDHNVRSGVG